LEFVQTQPVWVFYFNLNTQTMEITPWIIGALMSVLGFGAAKIMEKGKASKTIASARKEALDIIKNAKVEAENIKKDKIFQAKEKFLELKAEHE